MKGDKFTAVFDTNIYISALLFPGSVPERLYLRAIGGTFQFYTSVAILTETSSKLSEKFDWEEEQIIRFLRSVSKVATVVKTSPSIHLLADEPDNRILECGLKTRSDFIVTGDKHLLALKSYNDIVIIRPAEFLRTLGK